MHVKNILAIVQFRPGDGEIEKMVNEEIVNKFLYPARYFIYAIGFFCLYNWWNVIGVYMIVPISCLATLLICQDIGEKITPAETWEEIIPAVIINVIRIFQGFFHGAWIAGILAIFGGID